MKFLFGYKLFENVQQAKSILKELEISEDDKDYQTIRQIFKGNEGFVGWFTKMRYKNNIPLSDLNNIVDLIKNHNQLIRSLPQNLVEYDTYESLLDDIELTKTKIEVKKCYDEFPSTQRKLLDLTDDVTVQLLKTLQNIKNKSAYFAKVARYKNEEILIDSIKSFIEGNSKKTDFDEIVRSTRRYGKTELIPIDIDKEHDLIIIRAINPSVVSGLGRGTSWCIVDHSTFRSYVPNDETCQYMIWLTDMPIWSNYSIIGVTIGPKGYRTGHLKDDSYLPIGSLIEILSQRGFDVKKLYPKLEKSYDYTVPELRILFGMSDDEILDNKKLDYNSIQHFTKETLDSKGITSQFTILMFDSLLKMGYTKPDIMKHKTSFHSSELKHLTQNEIRKIGFDKFQLSDLVKHFDINEIVKDKTSVNGSHEFETIGPDIIMKYDMTIDDIRMSQLIKYDHSNYVHRKEHILLLPFEYILTHKRKWIANEFNSLTKEQAVEVLNKYNVEGYLSSTFIDKTKFTKEEVLKYHDRLPGVSPIYLGEIGLTIDECSKNKINVAFVGQDQSSYTEYNLPTTKPTDLSYIDHDKKRKGEWRKLKDFYDILAGGSNSTFSDDKGNRVRAFNLIKFYNLDLFDSIELCKCLSLKSHYDPSVVDVIDYLTSKGLNPEDDIFKVIDDMVDRYDRDKAKVKVVTHFKLSNLYPHILKIIEESDINIGYLDSIPDTYQSLKDKIINGRKVKDINNDRAVSPWYSGMGSQRGRSHRSGRGEYDTYEINSKELDDIYKVFEKAKGVKWVNDTWHRVDGSILVFFFALVKLNKLDEFKDLDYEFTQKTMNKLLGHLCHADRANGRTCVGILLTEEEELRAYNWIKNNFFKDPELFPLEERAPIVYRYDKPYYEKLFKDLLEAKAEYTYINRLDKKVEKDLKIHNFKKLIGYFTNSKDFNKQTSVEAFKQFLDKFLSSIKLTKQQTKDTRSYLLNWSNYPFGGEREELMSYVREKMPEEPKIKKIS